jgi:chromatin structure-remodeling complex subunit RSC1/2
LKNIQASVEKGRYRDASDVYTDLSLVFWNALFYNEPGSQIAMDAGSLKVSNHCFKSWILLNTFCFLTLPQTLLEAEWTKRSVLPQLRTSPPPSSAQKVHGVAAELNNTTPAPLPAAPAGQVLNASSNLPIQQRAPDPDADITHDSDGPQEDELAAQTDRDPQSDEIIKQLEKGIPAWPGFGEEGWMDEVKPVSWNMHTGSNLSILI